MRHCVLFLTALACSLPCSSFRAARTAHAEPKKDSGRVIQQLAGGYVWVLKHFDFGDELLLYLQCYDGSRIQVGNYRIKDGRYWRYDGPDRWTRDVEPPVSLPPGYVLRRNFGMTWKPEAKDENVLHFGGGQQPDVRKVIKRASDASEVPNYNGMWSVTVVSTDAAKRKQVLDDLAGHPALGRWKAERIKEYAPDSWALAPFKLAEDTSFQSTGLVTLVSPPCDSNFKSPVEAIYGYAGAEDLASRLRDVEARYNPNVHAGQSHAGLTPGTAAALSGGLVLVFCLVVGAAIVVGVIVVMWPKRPAPVAEEGETK